MTRRLFILAALLSLALCLGTAVLCVRSYLYGDLLSYYREPRIFEVHSNDGLVLIAWGCMVSDDYPNSPGWEGSIWPFHRRVEYIEADLRRGTTMGFALQRWQKQSPGFMVDTRQVTLPWLLLTICSALTPTAAVIRWRRERRRRHRLASGLCPACGFDLRASSGRCPECGAVPAEAKA
jgi:hypothetical protein